LIFIRKKINIQKFCTRTWFSRERDAGEFIKMEGITKTGLPIISLYGENKSQNQSNLQELTSWF
jgi:hypothetical protein